MNCKRFKEQLASFVYGELPADENARMELHLADCGACRNERASLKSLLQLLDLAPAPEQHVDLNRLYAAASWQRGRQVRRWRRIAMAATTAAAAVVAVFFFRCEVRFDGEQVVIRWSQTDHVRTESGAKSPTAVSESTPAPPTGDEQIQLLKDLVHALAKDIESRDRLQRQEFARLTQRLQDLQRLNNQQRLATDRDVAALYTAFFGPKEKGTKQ